MKTLKKIWSVLLSAALVIGFMGSISLPVYASTGKWVLVSEKAHVPSKYLCDEDPVYKRHDFSYSKDKSTGVVTLINEATDRNSAPPSPFAFYCIFNFNCPSPKASYSPGEEVSLKMNITTKNSTAKHHSAQCFSGYGMSDSDTAYLTVPFTDKTDKGRFPGALSEPTDSTGITVDGNNNVSKTVTGNMPEGARDGDYISIYFGAGHPTDDRTIFYEWKYRFDASAGKNSSSEGSTDKSSSVETPAITEISDLTGAWVKVVLGRVSGAEKYQIKYKVDGSNIWKSVVNSSNTFKIGVEKGKKVIVKARAFAGSSASSWSGTKSLKTDNK